MCPGGLADKWDVQTDAPAGSDTLLATLRLLAARPLEPDPPAVAELVRAVVAQTAAPADPVPVGRDRYSYLSPAERPDELGRLGRYRILRVLGEGGMGTVFAAEDLRLGRMVAVKTLRPELAGQPDARQRFLREARAAATISHENVIPIFAVEEAAGAPFLVMPLLQGETLQERLTATTGPLPVAEVVALGKQIADGLAAAHRHGVIHRDVKPGNVFLERCPDGEGETVRLLDFGLARAAADDAALTRSGVILGTPAYIAPEQAAGEPVDARADLFSLGSVLYHMTTGRRPYTGPNNLAVLWKLGQSPPPAPHRINPEVPPALSRLIVRLMDRDPERRPHSADEVASELPRIAAPPRPARRRSPRAVLVLLGLLLTVCVTALAGMIVVRSRTPDGRPVEIQVPDDRPMMLGKDGEVIINPPPGGTPRPVPEVPPPPSAGEPPAKPTAAEPVRDFVACHGLTGKEFDTWLKKDADGFRLHWLDVRVFGKETRFSAVAVKSVSRGVYELRHRVPDDDHAAITEDWKEMTGRGFRPVWDWRYVDGEHIYRTRLWTKDGQGYLFYFGPPPVITKPADRVIGDGYTLSAIVPYHQPVGPEYILTTDSNRRPMTYSLNAPRDPLPEYVKQIEAKGWSLDQLTAHDRDGAERFIVVVSKNANKPARTVEWDVPADKFAARVADQKRAGVMPWCLTGYGPPTDTKFAVIWCPFDPEKK